MEKGKSRCFNLLFLEEDEEYIDDMLAVMKKMEGNNSTSESRGRLRLCSRSLIFEPYNNNEDVLKFSFKKLENIKLYEIQNEIVIRTSEIVKIKTAIHGKKTRCTSQFTYDRKSRRAIGIMNNYYNDYTNEIKNIDNHNIDEHINIFEKILNNFGESEAGDVSDAAFTFPSSQEIKSTISNINTLDKKGEGISLNEKNTNVNKYGEGSDNGLSNVFLCSFKCDGASLINKKIKLIYNIVVKIKSAIIIHEKQMEILIKEKKNRQRNLMGMGNENDIGGSSEISQGLNVNNNCNEEMERKEINLELYIQNIIDKLSEGTKFDISSISLHETIISNKMEGFWVFKISPLVKMKGILNITNKYIYFQPNPNFTNKKEKKWEIDKILHVFKRIITMKPNSLEIIFDHPSKKYKSLYVEFVSYNERQIILNVLKNIKPECLLIDDNPEFLHLVMDKWANGLITNYEYIDFLNCISGRSRKDFSQYPVFPWILSDYSSKKIDLNNERVYRDLTKPVGCLNENRLNSLIEKMHDHEYFFGSHYSTLAYVVYFLIRIYPECQLKLQSGKFDTLSRMFVSVETTFNTALNANSSFIELIPELYENNEHFLKNYLSIQTSEGNLEDVILPRWCNNANDFLTIMKNAMESNYVNKNLHEWINLIFGYKQKGQIARDNINLFHPLTYMHAILYEKLSTNYKTYKESNSNNTSGFEKLKSNITGLQKQLLALQPHAEQYEQDNNVEQNFKHQIKSLITSMSSKALKTQLHEFGQCPYQLFKESHIPKKSNISFELNKNINNFPWYYSPVIIELLEDIYYQKKKSKKRRSENCDSIDNSNQEYSVENSEIYNSNNDEHSNKSEESDNNLYVQNRDGVMTIDEYSIDNKFDEKTKPNNYSNYFKTHLWKLEKVDNIPCNIKGVCSNDNNNICFICENGFVKIIDCYDLLNSKNKNNKNLISLKLCDETFSCLTNINTNFIMGTINGNLIFMNTQSVIKKMDSNKHDTMKGKTKNSSKSADSDLGSLSKDDNDDDSCDGSSVCSSFDDVFNYKYCTGENEEGDSKNITQAGNNENVYNKLIKKKIHNDTISCMSYNNNYLATGSYDETIQLINVENNFEIIQTYDNFNSSIKNIELKNKLLFTRSDEINLFDIRMPPKNVLNNVNNSNQFLKNFTTISHNKKNYINNIINGISFGNLLSMPFSNNFLHDYKFEPLVNGYEDKNYNINLKKKVKKNMKNLIFDNDHSNEENYLDCINKSYTHSQYLFEKKIKKNMNYVFSNRSCNIVYSSLVNDNNILCLDENKSLYFYDIRAEKWINKFSDTINNNLKQNYNDKIVVASSYKQHLCTVNSIGKILFEPIRFSINFLDNKVASKLNVLKNNCSISNPTYINFLNSNFNSLGDAENTNAVDEQSVCNHIMFTNLNGDIEIHKKY
ncbi:beige/BEACH domain protein, putative [Plasmodium vinckei]|uniref:Beige/BEACH domain protein, putative n=1 Tax=Plasmodium vinckei TaxID=5860 RepID=A0A6V7SWZ6_PLAVN|nr:beige/BEACH domain protein, putative [Plasmodium vinckei]